MSRPVVVDTSKLLEMVNELIIPGQRSVSQIAEEMGVAPKTLYRWLSKESGLTRKAQMGITRWLLNEYVWYLGEVTRRAKNFADLFTAEADFSHYGRK